MFKWLRSTDGGLADVEERFLGMLSDGRHVFDLAMSARLGGADPDSVSRALLETEERTDEAEREIRRRVIVHASVQGTGDLAACLMYMSIAKDAERIADLSKNLFEVSQAVGPPPPGELRDDLIATRDKVSPMIAEAARIFADDDQEAAQDFIERARGVQQHCMGWIVRLVRERVQVPQPAAAVLTFRHMARILANLMNILSAVVMPLDQLDYPDYEPGGGGA